MQETGEIDAVAARVYRLRVIHPTDTVEQISARAGITPQETLEAESRLSALGLLRPSPSGGQVAVSPETAADTLLAPMEQDILQRRIAMAATRARLHALSGDYLEARSMRSAKSSIEIVQGTDNARAVIDDLVRTCSESLDALVPGSGLGEVAVRAAISNDREMLERGVKMRSLFQHSARKNRAQVRHVAVLTDAGAQVRSTTVLPSRMAIYDRSCAVLPLDPERGGAGAAVIRDPTVLNFLQQLFEHYWDRALDFSEEEQRDGPEPNEVERDVLLLMAAGKKDEAIAHQLGMSPRSVSRIVARLMERLGAESRFQAGARAALNGWLSDD
ncbi:LuxR C-terminal-related transcriptional regulator [Streptomyces sp. 4N509B]|uniref:LuxR C-terminal-related transcriptional regulator n=1 Tax=Streptomyces sp. 4N509B TaxID=3457413 RepID=UPI003FD22AD2